MSKAAPHSERIQFEARVDPELLRKQRWAGLLWLGFVPFHGADSWMELAGGVGVALMLLALTRLLRIKAGAVVLRITDQHLHGHFANTGRVRAENVRAAIRMMLGRELESIAASEVRGIAWEQDDMIAIRLADGTVTPVQLGFLLAASEREAAHRSVRAFMERAIGVPLPPREAPLDVAPWVVRRAQ